MISKKGFLFTISIILFASTIVIFAQVYLNNSMGVETRVLSNYAMLSQPILNDNIASNLKKIVGFDLDLEFQNNNIIISINDSLPKDYNVSQKISSYESFLENSFFPIFSGEESIDFTNLKDGSIELFFNDLFVYNVDYDLNENSFVSNSSALNSIDLNLFVDNNLNYYEWVFVSGNTDLNLYYFDSNTYFYLTESISPTSANTLNLVYNDYNSIIVIENNSFNIDSGAGRKIDFDLRTSYDFDSNNFPVWFNALLNYSSRNISSSSLIKIKN